MNGLSTGWFVIVSRRAWQRQHDEAMELGRTMARYFPSGRTIVETLADDQAEKVRHLRVVQPDTPA